MISFSMLLINNNRSKAYLQNLIKNNFFPERVIVLNDSGANLPEQTENDTLISKNTKQKFIRELKDLDIGFDEKEHILFTLNKYNIDYVILDTLDINEQLVVSEVNAIPTEYILYSGPGGSILRKHILMQGKKFIHVQPGWL